jgi:hypothetical protein
MHSHHKMIFLLLFINEIRLTCLITCKCLFNGYSNLSVKLRKLREYHFLKVEFEQRR